MSTLPSFKGELQVLCCRHCKEVLNEAWFKPETLPPHNDPNPYRGRCRNCGSREFAVGLLPATRAFKLVEEGFKLMPFMHDLDIDDPFVKNNIFDMGKRDALHGSGLAGANA